MTNPTGNRSCSVCGAPEQVRKFIDDALTAEPRTMTLRELEKETAFSKATLSRHRARCLPKAAARAHRGFASRRVVWQMAENSYRVECEDDIEARITEAELKDSDVIIRMEFRERQVTNPSAHLSRSERAQKRQRAEIRPETPSTESELPAQPSESSQPEKIAPSPVYSEQSPSDAPPQPENCQHDLKRVSGDVWKCQKCGWQPPQNVIVGQSRAAHFSKKSGPFGRFG